MSDDIFKVVPLRILGFSFGFAQAAKYKFSLRKVDMCYGCGVCFVVCHIVHTAITKQMVYPVLHAICFEGLCSCLIPPFVNYYFCGVVADIVYGIKPLPFVVRRWSPFIAGILTIPLLMEFVDPEIDKLLDSFFLE